MTAILLALGASISWGVGDFVGGVSSRRLATLTVLAVSEVAGFLALVVLVAVRGDDPLATGATLAALAAGAAGLVGLGGLYQGMAVGAIGVVAPVSGLAALVPLVYGLSRGERPGAVQLAGALLILAGVVLVSREPGRAGARVAAGVGFAVLSAIGFGLYYVLIDAASEESAAWAVCVARGTASVVAVTVAAAWRAPLVAPARMLPWLVAIGLFDAGANVLLAAALNRGYTSIVAVVASLYPVVTIVLAASLLREHVAPLRMIGIAGALGGVALVSAG
ncbi:MAG: EamA family transporter [Pseudomonadota bacterium]